jgi:hypothetical protein
MPIPATSAWQQLLAEFAPIPPLIQKVAPENRAYLTKQMQQDPIYFLLESLTAPRTIVYSPPKVGGQTIAATLWEHPAIPQPIHIHFMSPKGIAFMESLIEQSRENANQHQWQTLLAHSRWVRSLLASNRLVREAGFSSAIPKPVVIAGVREPMAQYLSMVFQAWWMYADSPGKLDAAAIRARMDTDPWREMCDTWFEDELRQTLSIDVYARPFPTDRGWDIYENETARVLIIRQENLGQLPEAIGLLYGIDPGTVKLETRNRAEEKEYAAEYAAVKKAWQPGEKELDRVYGSAYVGHFYTAAEIASYRERWRSGAKASPRHAAVQATPKTAPPVEPRASLECGHEAPAAVSHSRGCRPCPKCSAELQSIPVLKQACDERLELIKHLDGQLHVSLARQVMGRVRRTMGRLLRVSRARS